MNCANREWMLHEALTYLRKPDLDASVIGKTVEEMAADYGRLLAYAWNARFYLERALEQVPQSEEATA